MFHLKQHISETIRNYALVRVNFKIRYDQFDGLCVGHLSVVPFNGLTCNLPNDLKSEVGCILIIKNEAF